MDKSLDFWNLMAYDFGTSEQHTLHSRNMNDVNMYVSWLMG